MGAEGCNLRRRLGPWAPGWGLRRAQGRGCWAGPAAGAFFVLLVQAGHIRWEPQWHLETRQRLGMAVGSLVLMGWLIVAVRSADRARLRRELAYVKEPLRPVF